MACQDGSRDAGRLYLSETIAQNIAVGEEQIDVERLRHAVAVANIRDFIDSLPLGYNTKIGMEGNGISQGQKQRLLIARAVYKIRNFFSSTKPPMPWMRIMKGDYGTSA